MGIPLPDIHKNSVVFIRDGIEYPAMVAMQGKQIHAQVDINAKVDDLLRWPEMHEEYMVTSVERYPGDELGHAVVRIVSVAEWRRRHPEPQPSITQHIGSAQVVSGRDIHGGVTIGVTGPQLIEILRKAIEDDPSVPEEQKKSIVEKLKDIATNPYVIGLGANALHVVLRALGYLPGQ